MIFPLLKKRRDCGGLYHLAYLLVKGFLKIFIVWYLKRDGEVSYLDCYKNIDASTTCPGGQKHNCPGLPGQLSRKMNLVNFDLIAVVKKMSRYFSFGFSLCG